MAKKKWLFKPLIRCGCPEKATYGKGEIFLNKCTCAIVSPKTGARGRVLSPRGEYRMRIVSDPDWQRIGTKPFKKLSV